MEILLNKLLDRLDLYIDDYEELPDIAIVTIWGNDGLRRMSVDQMQKNIESIVTQLQEKNVIVVLSGMRLPLNLWLNYIGDFKSVYEEIAKEYDLYFFSHFLKDVQWNPNLNLQDMIHPNKEWYAIIAENVYNFLIKNKLVQK